MRDFKKTKVSNLMGETEVRFTQEATDTEREFQLVATAAGVRLKGESEMIYSEDELQQLAKGFDDVWRAHKKLKPKFEATISGH